mmetsp:Transcript_31386/g.67443  ORF Transcript_31386/g.67443 Transcript_31386/m.67443 type:complete len:265 (-) Transcript_31386:525-1319(-)
MKSENGGADPAKKSKQAAPPQGQSTRARGLDVSNGKALFRKHGFVQYNSVTQGTWVDAEVIFVREDGSIMIDLKDGHWFSVADQRSKFREGRRKAWAIGTELQYFSLTQGGWTDCTVTNLNPADHAVMINIKAEYWMSVDEQDQKLRLPCLDKYDELIYEASRLLERDNPDVASAEQRYREVLKAESDHVVALEAMAVLHMNHRSDLAMAENYFRKALDENPWSLRTLTDLGDILKVTRRAEEGKRLHKRWRKVRDRLKELEED